MTDFETRTMAAYEALALVASLYRLEYIPMHLHEIAREILIKSGEEVESVGSGHTSHAAIPSIGAPEFFGVDGQNK